jgi:hypothetical protein
VIRAHEVIDLDHLASCISVEVHAPSLLPRRVRCRCYAGERETRERRQNR